LATFKLNFILLHITFLTVYTGHKHTGWRNRILLFKMYVIEMSGAIKLVFVWFFFIPCWILWF